MPMWRCSRPRIPPRSWPIREAFRAGSGATLSLPMSPMMAAVVSIFTTTRPRPSSTRRAGTISAISATSPGRPCSARPWRFPSPRRSASSLSGSPASVSLVAARAFRLRSYGHCDGGPSGPPFRCPDRGLHRRDRRHRRADGARQAERRGGQEEARAPVLAQPVGELREIPEFAEIDAEAEEAMGVERQGGAARPVAIARGMRLDRVIVRDERDKAALRHPLLQLLVAAVEDGAGIGEPLGIGPAVHLEDDAVEAGAQADEIARLDDDPVRRYDGHQRVMIDPFPFAAEMRFEVDHDAASLDAASRHVLDPERPCPRGSIARRLASAAIVDGSYHVPARAVAVVIDHLGNAVAIGVEELPDMGEAVPLRRILQRDDRDIVADDVGMARVVPAQRIVHHRLALAPRRFEAGRMAARVEKIAARVVERQAEAEAPPLANLGDALQHLDRRQQVEPAQLVVRPEIAPVRSWRALLPSWASVHAVTPLDPCRGFHLAASPSSSSGPISHS